MRGVVAVVGDLAREASPESGTPVLSRHAAKETLRTHARFIYGVRD